MKADPASRLRVLPYERRFRTAALDLIHDHYYVHQHLDWHEIERWLGIASGPGVVAVDGHTVVGVLAASEPYNHTAWLRVIALHDRANLRSVLNVLWPSLRDALRAQGVRSAWLLISVDWLRDYAPLLGMAPVETIVTLKRTALHMPPQRNTSVQVIPAEAEHLETLLMIDNSAFAPPWQMTREEMRQALRMAENSTLALDPGGSPIGYQISTRYHDTGHLARLAVLPDIQSRGVGGAMLHALILAMHRRGARVMTVNTQETNLRSQRLYGYYHFRRNGYDMPVWAVDL